MTELKMGVIENRFADIIWNNEPANIRRRSRRTAGGGTPPAVIARVQAPVAISTSGLMFFISAKYV
ncbi:MAG: hypothetical protein PUC29_03525 [Clostridia bacterium]|nr:hypothetical protein [Clostridia bacterium]